MVNIEVRGRYFLADGAAATGRITFTPRSTASVGSGLTGSIIVPATAVARLVAGAFTVELQATDDPALAPGGWTYEVQENVSELAAVRTYDITVPIAALVAGIDLVDIAPVSAADGDPSAFPTLAAFAALDARVTTIEDDGPYDVAGAAAAAQVAATTAAQLATITGARVAYLGDSVTLAQANDTPHAYWGTSFPTYATYLTRGRALRVRNAGVAGDRAANMLARFDADVTTYAPSAVVIMAGANDWNDSTPTTLASYQASIAALVAKCRQIGARPILCTAPPNVLSSARRARTIVGNAWLRNYCAANGIPLVDMYTLLTDPATGDYLTAYGSATNDKTHPIGAGYVAMGAHLATVLTQVLPPFDQLLPAENADPNNMLVNGLNLTTTGSATTLMPTGWAVQSSVHPAGVTGSLVTGDAAIKGNWWKVEAVAATATNNEFQTVGGIIPGHTYAHVGRFKATGMKGTDTGNGSSFLIGCAFNSVLNNSLYDFRAASSLQFNVADGAFYQEVLAPVDAATCLVRRQLLNTTSGAGTLQVAQTGFYDLTAMGLAA